MKKWREPLIGWMIFECLEQNEDTGEIVNFDGMISGPQDPTGANLAWQDPVKMISFDAYLAKCQEFKNFHKMVCEAVGYGHDETDWIRDQLSLVNSVAALQSKVTDLNQCCVKLEDKFMREEERKHQLLDQILGLSKKVTDLEGQVKESYWRPLWEERSLKVDELAKVIADLEAKAADYRKGGMEWQKSTMEECQKVRDLKAEIERHWECRNQLDKALADLEAKAKGYESALKFYSDGKHWTTSDHEENLFIKVSDSDWEKREWGGFVGGKRARQALKEQAGEA